MSKKLINKRERNQFSVSESSLKNVHQNKEKYLTSKLNPQIFKNRDSLIQSLPKLNCGTENIVLESDLVSPNQFNYSPIENMQIQKKIPLFQEMIRAIKFKFMAHRFLSSTRSFMFKNMSIRQFQQIDDKSWFFDQKENKLLKNVSLSKTHSLNKENLYDITQENKFGNSSNNGISKKIKQLISLLNQFCRFLKIWKFLNMLFPVVEPTSLRKIIWDFISLVAMIIYLILIPFYITFAGQFQILSYKIMIISIPSFLLLDLIFSLNTGCYDKGCLIKQRSILFHINLKKIILPNLIIITCYFVIIIYFFEYQYQIFIFTSETSNNYEESPFQKIHDYLLLSLILKLPDFGNILGKLQQHTIFSKKYRNIINLLKLILTIVYIGHIIACFWIKVAIIEFESSENNWSKFNDLETISWKSIYINALYFSMVTMTTVGYGDFVPVNEVERTISIVIIVASSGVFAYSMNTIGQILQSFNEDELKKTMNMTIINSYMIRKNVSKQMKNQILEYLDYYWKEESERDQEQEDKIINLLSDNLKKNLLVESKNVVLKKSAIFRNNFSDAVKEKIVPLIKEYRCSPEEIIFFDQEKDDCSIYFIEKGSVEIFIEDSNQKQGKQKVANKIYIINLKGLRAISSLGKGSSFGELSFFTGKLRSTNIRSREFTTLLILNRDQFLDILINHKEDYEKFCMIRDSLDMYENYSLINLSCLSCRSESHQLYKCPYSHFQANTNKLRQQFMMCPSQERKKMKRGPRRRSNSLFNQFIVKDIGENYKEEHNESIEYLNMQAFEKENIEYHSASEQDDSNEEESLNEKIEVESLDIKIEQNQKNISSSKQVNISFPPFEDDLQREIFHGREQRRKNSNISKQEIIPEVDEDEINEDVLDIFTSKDMSGKPHNLYSSIGFQQSKIIKGDDKKQFTNKGMLPISTSIELHEDLDFSKGKQQRLGFGKNDAFSLNQDKSKSKIGINLLKSEESKFRRQAKTQKTLLINNSKLDDINASGNPIFPRNGFRRDLKDRGRLNTIIRGEKKMTIFLKNSNGSEESFTKSKQSAINESKFKESDYTKFNSKFKYPVEQKVVEIPFNDYFEEIFSNLVEDDFDIMHNFEYYFPQNNLRCQIELLAMDKDEKRRKMIWNSYDAQSGMKFISQTLIKGKRSSQLASTTQHFNNEKNNKPIGNTNSKKNSQQQVSSIILHTIATEHSINSLINLSSSKKLKYQFSNRKIEYLETNQGKHTNHQTETSESNSSEKYKKGEVKHNTKTDHDNQIQDGSLSSSLYQTDLSINRSINSERQSSQRGIIYMDVELNNFNLKSKRIAYRMEENFPQTNRESQLEISQIQASHLDEDKDSV